MLEEPSFLAWLQDGGTAHFVGLAGQPGIISYQGPRERLRFSLHVCIWGVGNANGKRDRAPSGIMGLSSNALSWKLFLKKKGGVWCN